MNRKYVITFMERLNKNRLSIKEIRETGIFPDKINKHLRSAEISVLTAVDEMKRNEEYDKTNKGESIAVD